MAYWTVLDWAGRVSPLPKTGFTAFTFNWSIWSQNRFPGLTYHMTDGERTEVAFYAGYKKG